MLRTLRFCFILLFSAPLFPAVTTAHTSLYFSPEDRLAEKLIKLIDEEAVSIRIAVYNLSHRGIADALMNAHKRGVSIDLVVDKFSVKVRSPLLKLSQAGVPVSVWSVDCEKTKKTRRPLMHNKFCIFGENKVWTGSFNFSHDAATIHQENAMVLEDKEIAKAFIEKFTEIKNRGCEPYETYVAEHYTKKKVFR